MIFKKQDERGIALITSLILSLIAIVLASAIMILVVSSTKQSGIVKRYTSALEAAKGGVEEFLIDIRDSTWDSNSSGWIPGHACKLKRDTDNWTTVCDFCNSTNACTSNSEPSDIINNPDWEEIYGDYIVYGKIVDTKGYLDGYLYNVEIVGTNNSTSEMAWINVLYQIKLNP
ncbi:MAG: hypothetical protein PWR24_182 [Desulfonauticus sp.]|nr:MAG: hypothetical protein XD41_0146 [Desulfonauticus sp. 38_4375]MDK2920625.1 hypothetical protein [Desulfonauticus sp.]